MSMRLSPEFFNRNTPRVARDLLGKYLVRQIAGRQVAAMITETEAYHGLDDRASHGSRGLTPRTSVMYGLPGHTYIYMVYGMHFCLNFSAMPEGFPAAVLIRAVDLPGGNGPGRLCRQLKVDKT